MDGSTQRVIGTAALLSVGVGTLNSFYKHKRPPSMRFLIGSGAAYVILSAIGEGEPEVAKALAVAVAVTTIIGDGGGVLSYISNGEIDTTKKNPNTAGEVDPLTSSAELYEGYDGPLTPEKTESFAINNSVAATRTTTYRPDTVGSIPGLW